MRFHLLVSALSVVLILSSLSWARADVPTTLESFHWPRNGQVRMTISQNRVSINLKGDLRDGQTSVITSSDGQITVNLKSYNTELFNVVAISNANDDSAAIFILECPQGPADIHSGGPRQEDQWDVMNQKAIRTRKVDVMTDFESVMKGFKIFSNFSLANSLRKTVEYFEKNPTKRLQDLLASLERQDEALLVLPKPKGSAAAGSEGVSAQDIPSTPMPGGDSLATARRKSRDQNSDQPSDQASAPADDAGTDSTIDADALAQVQKDWAQQERERQRKARAARRRRQKALEERRLPTDPDQPPQTYTQPYVWGQEGYGQPYRYYQPQQNNFGGRIDSRGYN